jgi:4'-phosphopantetheinyl transferase
VWLVATDQPDAVVARLADLLDPAETERARGFEGAADRRRYTVAHGAVRAILADELGVAPDAVRWRYGRHGKPALVDAGGLEVNLSHSGELAALAVSPGRAVGIDLQWMSGTLDALRMSARFFTAEEASYVAAARADRRMARFVRLWTRKEACVKAAGGRLSQGLRLPVPGPGAVLVHRPGSGLPGPFLVRDLPAPPGYGAAVALVGADPYAVSRRWWDAGSS